MKVPVAYLFRRVLVAGVVLALAAPAGAQSPPTPIRIADQTMPVPGGTGNFLAFNPNAPPSTDRGLVVFRSGDGSIRADTTGLYMARPGGPPLFVADTDTHIPDTVSSRFGSYSVPAADGRGRSGVFNGATTSGFSAGIFRSTGGPTPKVIAKPSSVVPGAPDTELLLFPPDPPSTDGDAVVFRAGGETVTMPPADITGVYKSDGESLHVVADRNTPVPDGFGTFTQFGAPVVDGDLVAFQADGPIQPPPAGGVQSGIYLSDGSMVSVIADRATVAPDGERFNLFGTATSLDEGNVAFWATTVVQGIHTTQGGALRTVADTNSLVPGTGTRFTSFDREPAIDRDAIAFVGNAGVLGGLFVERDRAITRVVGINQLIDGKRVNDIFIGKDGFRDGILTFVVILESGGVLSSAIYALVFEDLIQQTIIDFDRDANGDEIPHLARIDDEYEAIGVHFTGGYHAGRTDIAFPTYTVRPSPNYLCTYGGTVGDDMSNCEPPDDPAPGGEPNDAPLGAIFDKPMDFVSIEGYTRNDLVEDVDGIEIEAFNKFGTSIAVGTGTCSNAPDFSIEGVCVVWVEAPGIRRVEIRRIDFPDALDTMVLTRGEEPVYRNGDVNGNGCIDRTDLDIVVNSLFFGVPAPIPEYDVNGDGVFNVADARTEVGLFDNPAGAPCE